MRSLQRSQRQEKRAADLLGGTVNSGSGNGPYRKNDVRSEEFSVECKTTEKKSYSLKLDDLLKAEKYALLDGRTMLFFLEICGYRYVVMTEADFEEMRGSPHGT